MNLNRLFYITFCLAFFITACSDDDDNNTGGTETTNYNANNTTVNSLYGRYEVPRIDDAPQYQVLVHSTSDYGVNMIIEWDCGKKAQRWTAYQMYRANSVSNWNRNNWKDTEWKGDPFQADPTLAPEYRTELEDYRETGFQRGHICPSADRLCSKEANEQTFYLSNMHPQIGAFNTGVWQTMETQLRKWNVDTFRDTLFVCKGGTIADGQTIAPSKLVSNSSMSLPVPQYFFMAILCKKSGTYMAIAFWAEHKADNSVNLAPYTKSIDELEELTGIDFFCNLPDNVEDAVESICSPSAWGL